jgi:hypothetical protein
MTTERRRALAALLDEIAYCTQFKNHGLDAFDDEILTEAIAVLGVDQVGELLREYNIDADLFSTIATAASQSEDTAAAHGWALLSAFPSRSKLEQFLIDHCRGASEQVESLLRALDWRLEPAVLGRDDLPTDPPTGVHATLIGDFGRVSWQTARLVDPGALLVQGVGAAEALTTAVTCKPNVGGRADVDVDAEAVAKSAHRGAAVFYVVGGGRDWKDDPGREILVLIRPDHPRQWCEPASGGYHPAISVCDGYIAQGWSDAIALGFGDEELLALQAMIWPRMRLLLEGVKSDNPTVARDISTVRGLLDARQHLVVQRIRALF